ncbi:putative HTH-type transcriptional regulator YybR [Janthinobacterium sp. HH106]|uniref:winged helix-turn-helix transcriptional regulator n=1 Tax=Janthinobacterium sp. HH106 TaxID=1537278 RepID=UPI000873F418|nr:helix-turn-helix domain-containing protein [Janthinobacterium sp. HH106]OEZ91930.1 putative HTH-type transcriptional regulator YybR [Janthinobacterium sp. HH106]
MKDNVSGCAVEEAMRLLGGRWRAVLLSYLMAGPKRFSEIRRAVPNISQRMLTLDLRALEEAGLLTRTIYAEVPVKVEYQLTDEGLRLRELVEMLRAIGLRLRGQADGGGAFLALDAVDSSL